MKLTSVTDVGNGIPVVCLHGFPQNSSAFDLVARDLCRIGFRVIRYDQRGYTEDTSHGARWAFTLSRLARDCIDVLDSLGVEQCILVGHDLGGTVAWEVARLAPERVRHLVVLGVPHPSAFVLSLLGVGQLLRAWYFVAAQSTSFSKLVFSPQRRDSRARFQQFLASRGMHERESSAYLDFLAADDLFVGALRWYQSMPFSGISAFRPCVLPTTLVWGQNDKFTVRAGIRLTRFWVHSSFELHELPDANHWLLDYNSSEVASIIATLGNVDSE